MAFCARSFFFVYYSFISLGELWLWELVSKRSSTLVQTIFTCPVCHCEHKGCTWAVNEHLMRVSPLNLPARPEQEFSFVMHWPLWSCFQDRWISEWHYSKRSFSQVVSYADFQLAQQFPRNRWFCRAPFFERRQIFVIVSRGSVPSLVDTFVSGLFSKNLPMPKSYRFAMLNERGRRLQVIVIIPSPHILLRLELRWERILVTLG